MAASVSNILKKTNKGTVWLLIAPCGLALLASKFLLSFEHECHLRLWEKSRLAAESAFINQDYELAKQESQIACVQARSLSEDDFRLGMSLQGLARTYAAEGNPSEAEAAYKEAVSTLSKCRSTDSASAKLVRRLLAESQKGLGGVLLSLGKWTEAEQAYKDALSQYDTSLSSEAPEDLLMLQDRAEIWAGLGLVYLKQGKLAQAEPLYKKALAAASESMISETTISPIKSQISELLLKTGRAKSTQLILPSPRWDRIWEEGQIAVTYSDLAKAERKFQEALKQAVKRFGPNDFRVVKSLLELSNIHRAQGDIAAEEQDVKQGLAILKLSPKDDEYTMYMLRELTNIYLDRKEWQKAETELKRLIQIEDKVRDPDSPKGAHSLCELAVVEIRLHRPWLAGPLLKQAEAIAGKAKRKKFVVRLSEIIHAYILLGDLDSARKVAQTSLHIATHELPKTDKRIGIALADTASVYAASGELEKSDFFFKESMREVDATRDPDIRPFVYRSYIEFLERTNRKVEAKALEERLKLKQ